VQEQNMNVEDEEIEQLSDLDSGDESGFLFCVNNSKYSFQDNSKGTSDGRKKRAGDIEDLIAAAMKSGEDELDKRRGFIKYKRQKVIYRPPEQRLKDWDEVIVKVFYKKI
jgi:hypothetical protein